MQKEGADVSFEDAESGSHSSNEHLTLKKITLEHIRRILILGSANKTLEFTKSVELFSDLMFVYFDKELKQKEQDKQQKENLEVLKIPGIEITRNKKGEMMNYRITEETSINAFNEVKYDR